MRHRLSSLLLLACLVWLLAAGASDALADEPVNPGAAAIQAGLRALEAELLAQHDNRDAARLALLQDPRYHALKRSLAASAPKSTGAAPSYIPEVEPNNTPAQATPLQFNGSLFTAHGSIRQGGDLDVYAIDVPTGARLWALVDTGGTLNPISNYRDPVLRLIAPDGTSLVETDDDDGTGNGSDGTVETELASVIAGRSLTASGTFYLSIRAFSATRAIDAYRLYVALTFDTVPEQEPNDTPATAGTLALGTVRTASLSGGVDIDYHKVTVTASGSLLFVSIDGDPERDGVSTDTRFDLLAPDGSITLLTVNSSGLPVSPEPQGEGAIYRVFDPGDYYVRVTHPASGSGSYHLLAQVFSGTDGFLPARVGTFNAGAWLLNVSPVFPTRTISFNYQAAPDIPLMCDWDGNGTRTPGAFRDGQWFLRNSLSTGAPQITLSFGLAGDLPVCGDWNGDSVETVGVFRAGQWLIRNTNGGGPPDLSFSYGLPGDIPVAGDWNGDGVDSIGVYRNGTWLLRDSASMGNPTYNFSFGLNTDKPVVGDWDGDGDDTIGVFRTGSFFFRNTLSGGPFEGVYVFGAANDTPLVWH